MTSESETPPLTAVIPVWDEHAELLRRCVRAIQQQDPAARLVIVDNASRVPIEPPDGATLINSSPGTRSAPPETPG